MLRNLSLSLALLLMTMGTFAQADPSGLFEKMIGTWQGEGERIQLISGRRIRIEARAVAVINGPRLVSHNEITEIPEGGPARHYVRDYWIQGTQTPEYYELGQNEQVTSQGHFKSGMLEVEQELGGVPAYVIRSRTQFDGQESHYQETAWHGEQELARTSIRYRRSP